jgi:TonB-dependent SusC/RagA subfamily outer membrane receptor
LIDNVEVSTSDLAKFHPDDIASFFILKDAAATALYGARGANEAYATRILLTPVPYSRRQIEATSNPDRNQYVYPAVDWMDILTQKSADNQCVNMNISGGGQIARYYIAGSFSQDNEILEIKLN